MRKPRTACIKFMPFVILSAFTFSPAMAQEGLQKDAAKAEPKIIAVKFHADWCGYCKAMGDVFEEMQAKFDTLPVLYVTLDQTRDFNRQQSKFHANALGLARVWSENGGKTGFILLINGKTKAVIAKLTHDQNLKAMGVTLVDAVKAASATETKTEGSGQSEGSGRE